jgi:ribonuclease Z
MRIIFLGTAGSAPTILRGLPSVAIEHNGEVFLFDCGEGTQRQMMTFHVNVSRIKAVFLSHTHGDHTLGMGGLVRTLALNNRTEKLNVYVPKGGEKIINVLINFDKPMLNIKINPIKAGEIYRGKDFSVSAFKLIHTTHTYGFVFKENDKLKFIKQKMKGLGMKGTDFSKLLKDKSIKIKNKTIKLKDITRLEIGKKIVYATDTRPAKETEKMAINADILIHESTYADSEHKLAKQRLHSTAVEAAKIAKAAKVKKLILVHPSARYKDATKLIKDAKTIFSNTEMAKDGLSITL